MRIIYVDDEKPALDNFRLTVAKFSEISHLDMFQDGSKALEYVEKNVVDVAFLDMEMPGIHGLDLAKELKKNKCTYRRLPSQQVQIQTIPTLSVLIDGAPLHISAAKPRELFALLVDRGSGGITTGEAISYLWPERNNDANTQSLMRMTYKRLVDILKNVGVENIIDTQENRRFLRVNQVDCDLYRILEGDKQAARNYGGQYLQEYSWAEERNSQLYWMLLGKEGVN